MERFTLDHSFDDIISEENLLFSWKEFLQGKRKKKDVQIFQLLFVEHILELQRELANGTYQHGPYTHFKINDPKPRDIHKATVRDRLLHHAIYRVLYPYYERIFVPDSYSCQLGKGTHRAVNTFRCYAYRASRNHTKTLWILKCDIRKFFASIDQEILINILQKRISDKRTITLLKKVIDSFQSTRSGKGLPLGNLTSQLLVNIYMNEFDQFVKHKLKVQYYIRYADDFVLLSHDRAVLELLLPQIRSFLYDRLRLELHPHKVFIKTTASGVDFLGWVHFPHHRVLRTTTKRRMLKRIQENSMPETIQSYIGLLKHGNTKKLRSKIEENIAKTGLFL